MEGNEALEQAETHLKEAESDLHLAHAAEIAAEDDLKLAHQAEGFAEKKIDEALREVHEAAEPSHDRHQILVEVATTSGFYPQDRSDHLPDTEVVETELEKAAKALKLTNTANWIASVNKRQIDTKLSYEANGLKDKVVVDWGPPAGGGGTEA
jgi:hypothetical protein